MHKFDHARTSVFAIGYQKYNVLCIGSSNIFLYIFNSFNIIIFFSCDRRNFSIGTAYKFRALTFPSPVGQAETLGCKISR